MFCVFIAKSQMIWRWSVTLLTRMDSYEQLDCNRIRTGSPFQRSLHSFWLQRPSEKCGTDVWNNCPPVGLSPEQRLLSLISLLLVEGRQTGGRGGDFTASLWLSRANTLQHCFTFSTFPSPLQAFLVFPLESRPEQFQGKALAGLSAAGRDGGCVCGCSRSRDPHRHKQSCKCYRRHSSPSPFQSHVSSWDLFLWDR